MTKYITPEKLENCLRAMSILDIIMNSKEEEWLRVTTQHEIPDGRGYRVDRGNGDSMVVLYTRNGVLLKGFDHENGLNQFGAEQWDESFFQYVYAGVPDGFLDMFEDKDERDSVTFCMWCTDGTDQWMQNETPDDAGGKDFLLNYVLKYTAEDWYDWAKDYYEIEEEAFDLEPIQKAFSGNPLSKEDILRINPTRDADEAIEEIAQLQ